MAFVGKDFVGIEDAADRRRKHCNHVRVHFTGHEPRAQRCGDLPAEVGSRLDDDNRQAANRERQRRSNTGERPADDRNVHLSQDR